MSNTNYGRNLLSGMERAFDCILLCIYWIIGCIPIVTIGTSTVALYHAADEVLHKQEGHISESFWRTYKNKFKSVILLWLIFMVIGAILVVDLQLTLGYWLDGLSAGWLLWVMCGLTAIYVVWLNYIFAYLARYDESWKVVIKKAIIMAGRELPWTVIMLVIFTLSAYVVYKLVFMMAVIPAIVVWLYAVIFERIFSKGKNQQHKVEE